MSYTYNKHFFMKDGKPWLPVMGGYCDAPWDERLTELEANDNYVFSGKRNDEIEISVPCPL